MSCMSAERRVELEAQRDKYVAIIAKLDIALLEGAASSYISNYELDTGAGKQKVTYRNIAEMSRGLKLFQSQLDRINSKLEGNGVVDFHLKRKGLRF